ncbi:MAG: hypothetical protein KBT21_08285 [Treponema sp.]|nr:hypothetical protein [Candidatus Treponema merdequi]
MKNKKNVSIISLIITFAFLAYIIFCFKPLKTELQLTPEWTVELESIDKIQSETNEQPVLVQTAVPELNVLPFKLGQNIGYFTHDGKISLLKNFDYKATISKKYFSTFSQNSSEIQIFDTNGQPVVNFSEGGFPYLSQDNILILLPGGSGFEAKSPEGLTLLREEHPAPITALNSHEYFTIAGYADGILTVFDENFKELFTLQPGGSDIEAVLGANISSKGNFIASVSGQNKQRFVLYKTEDNHSKVIFHKTLNNSVVNQTIVTFSKDESTVFYNDSTGLGIIDCNTFKDKHIRIRGKVLDIQESPVSNSFFVLSKERHNRTNTYTLSIIEAKSHKTGEFSFTADCAFILTDENSLFIGKDNKISKMTISKE